MPNVKYGKHPTMHAFFEINGSYYSTAAVSRLQKLKNARDTKTHVLKLTPEAEPNSTFRDLWLTPEQAHNVEEALLLETEALKQFAKAQIEMKFDGGTPPWE